MAEEGDALDLDRAPEGFHLDFDGGEIVEADGGTAGSGTLYVNFHHAALATAAADLVTAAVVLPPAWAIGVTANGTVTQEKPNVWKAENTIQLGGQEVTGHFTVAWVGIGWLAEMRVSSDDLDHALWFNGFLAYGGGLGWWDFYDDGQLVGVVEWIADGQGNAQFGMAALAGDAAGSVLSYAFTAADTARVDFHDGVTGEDSWVALAADRSGEVRLPNYNQGEAACWDVAFLNTECAIIE
ncbi:MAG: hypothetical protein JRI25_25740 [Deltaproteobacteria bacterium]|nr:hypothetical protein [Deltaproteobacteria bacterium]